MNTDKPGAPYYQRSVEETLASVQSSPEGLAEQRRLRACSSMAKTPCRRSRVNPPGCVLLRILTMC
ncbi:cation-transporting P-type ATPase [Klebsiella pneumoniae]|nr:cation-transporting P-type ATPase [Klebsiella pneumoniae]